MYIQQLKCKTNPRMIMINKACGAPDKMKYSDLLVIGFLTSCQPHRVTSGRSNSVISKCTFKHASHIYSQVKIYQINPYTNIKQNTHKHQTDIFKQIVPSKFPQLKIKKSVTRLVSQNTLTPVTIPADLSIPD